MFSADTVQACRAGYFTGGYEKAAEAGAVIAGGHTIQDTEPKYGLSVTGFVSPGQVLTNSGLKEGDLLIATKALGTGILTAAARAELLEPLEYRTMIQPMTELNKTAAEKMRHFPVNSCTDITGFGILGHAFEMAAASRHTVCLDAAAVPLLPKTLELAEMGILPEGVYRNRAYLSGRIQIDSKVPPCSGRYFV